MKNGIIMFFYVDDIVFAYRKHQTDIVRGLVDQLQQNTLLLEENLYSGFSE